LAAAPLLLERGRLVAPGRDVAVERDLILRERLGSQPFDDLLVRVLAARRDDAGRARDPVPVLLRVLTTPGLRTLEVLLRDRDVAVGRGRSRRAGRRRRRRPLPWCSRPAPCTRRGRAPRSRRR